MIHITSLGSLRGVATELGTFDLLTLLSPDYSGRSHLGFNSVRHLQLRFHDIVTATPGLVAPDVAMVQTILDFGRDVAPGHPLLIHCWAAISRSSAAAYMIACARNPGYEREIADELRRRAPLVTPNRLMVALADAALARDGRMTDAITAIGRGAEAFEGTPYRLPMTWPIGSAENS
jgi:predicted protein tyrosine phosphatase